MDKSKSRKPRRVAVPPHEKITKGRPKIRPSTAGESLPRSKSPKSSTRNIVRSRPSEKALGLIRKQPTAPPANPQAIYDKAIMEKDFVTAGSIFYDYIMDKSDQKELQECIKKAFPLGRIKGKQLVEVCKINMATNIEKYDAFYVSLYTMIEDGMLSDQHGATIVINEEVADVALKLAKLQENGKPIMNE